MPRAHMHIGETEHGYHVMLVCHDEYEKSFIGSISATEMFAGDGEHSRHVFIADGQDYASDKPGYQPKTLGFYPDSHKAEEAIRMHAYYSGELRDMGLLETAEMHPDSFQELAKIAAKRMAFLAGMPNGDPDDDTPLYADDVSKGADEPHRELPPELAQEMADLPREAIDHLMALNDRGLLEKVSVHTYRFRPDENDKDED